jgi:hypothetical protein
MQRTMSLKNRRIPIIIIISSRFPILCIFQVYTAEVFQKINETTAGTKHTTSVGVLACFGIHQKGK